MAITFPDIIPTWATDGGADIVDPGPAKRATGHIFEAPAHEHFNFMQNLYGEWFEGLVGALGPVMAFNNIEQTETYPFGPAAVPINYGKVQIKYDDLAGRWYAGIHEDPNDTDAGKFYESTDGVSWTAAPVTVASIDDPAFNAPVSNGSKVIAATEGNWWESPSVAATGLSPQGALPNAQDETYSLTYDATNGRFIHVGASGGGATGWVSHYSGTGSWTSIPTTGDNPTCHATSDTGRTVVTTGSNQVWISTNGTSFGQNTDASIPGSGFDGIVYSKALGMFLAYTAGSGFLLASLDGLFWEDLTTLYGGLLTRLFLTDYFVIAEFSADTVGATPLETYALHPTPLGPLLTGVPIPRRTFLGRFENTSKTSNLWAGRSYTDAGSRHYIPYAANNGLNIMRFGPSNG